MPLTSTEVLIIEFVGVPSAGKSTVASRLGDDLRQRGYAVYEPTYRVDHEFGGLRRVVWKFWTAGAWAIKRPHVAAAWLNGIVRSRQPSMRVALRLVLNAWYVSGTLARAAKVSGVHILDQGLAQSIWSVMYSGGRFKSSSFVRLFEATIPDCAMGLVLLEIDDLDALVRRLADRKALGRSRIDHLVRAGKDVRADVLRANNVYKSLIETLTPSVSKIDWISTIKVDAMADPAASVEKIRRALLP